MIKLFALVAAVLLSLGSANASTFDSVRQKGSVSCGVNVGLGGFSMLDSTGVWKGLDVDACRAVAAAVFGDPWAYNIVKQVANYSESYERNVGKGSGLKLDRGPNALWSQGGLMYPIPFR